MHSNIMLHFCRTTLLIAIVVIYMLCNIPRLALNLAEHLNQVREVGKKKEALLVGFYY